MYQTINAIFYLHGSKKFQSEQEDSHRDLQAFPP